MPARSHPAIYYIRSMEIEFSLETIEAAARRFWKAADGRSTVIALHGQMGAGKTTFVHALCAEKGVNDIVGSPTFSIINEYRYKDDEGTKKIYHLDLYRLRDEEEAIQAGVEDCLYSGSICLVEWPERAPGIFPENTVHVYIDLVNISTRRLRIERN